MSRDSFRYIAVILLLMIGIAGTQYVVGRGAFRMTESSSPTDQTVSAQDSPVYHYVVDLDTWQATERQREVVSPHDFRLASDLDEVPLRLGDWIGLDIEETNQEVFRILEPEQFVKRIYEIANDPRERYLWLFLIGGRQLKSFHHPDICYSAIDWRTTVGSEMIPLREGDLYALKISARNLTEEHLSLYFFIFPDDSYDESKGVVMFRVASPVWGSEKETIAFQKGFVRQFFE